MRWLFRLIHRRALEDDLDAELRFHFDEHVRELMVAGRSRREAEREARLGLGGIEQVKERARDVRGTRWLEDWWLDTRFTLRGFQREPGFAAVAVITLGLGVGSATAVFSAAYPVLFEPLAYPEPDRLVSIADRADDGSELPVTFGTYRELVGRSTAFETLAVYQPYKPTLTGLQEPERLEGQLVSAGYFRTLGVAPVLGPGFEAADDHPEGPMVVILSDGLWRRRFAADPSIVGADVSLDGAPARVVGVMPRDFDNVTAPEVQIWSLLRYDASLPSFERREWGRHLQMIGRARPGIEITAAIVDLEEVASNPQADFARPPWSALEQGFAVRRLREAATAASRPVALALFGAVLLLLGIACVNLANLMLVRGARRRAELAMRAALGAARGRLVRQVLTEGLVLAALGGALGLLLASLGVQALVALGPPELTRIGTIELSGAVLGFALGVTTLVGLVAGLVPAFSGGFDLRRDALAEAGHRVGSRTRARRALVVAEVALALVLLVGAGLMVRSVQTLFDIPPGFDSSGVVVLQVHAVRSGFDDAGAVHRFFRRSREAAEAIPGVVSAGWTTQLPLSGGSDVYGVQFENRGDDGQGAVYRYAVSPGYLDALGIAVRAGLPIGSWDVADSIPVALVSESLARRAFPGAEAVGQRLHLGRADVAYFTVVGVVADVKQTSLGSDLTDAVYVVPEQWYFADTTRWLVVRSEADPLALVPALRRAIWSVDPGQPIVRVDTMETLVTRSEARRRFAMILLQAFASLALLLAGIGLYGVLAGSVTERLHEIGVRSALGATPGRIRGLVVRQGLGLTGAGVVIGLSAAATISGALSSLLFGVSRLDPVTYATVAAILVVVASIACWIPAARAARVDPVRTLRAD